MDRWHRLEVPYDLRSIWSGYGVAGTIVASVGDPFVHTGQTAEDRFFGVQDAGGVLALRIVTPGGAQIETDHIMFGAGPAAPNDPGQVPEPSTLVLVGLGALRLARQRTRRHNR